MSTFFLTYECGFCIFVHMKQEGCNHRTYPTRGAALTASAILRAKTSLEYEAVWCDNCEKWRLITNDD